MRNSNEHELRETFSRVTIDDEASRQVLNSASHHQPHPANSNRPAAQLKPDDILSQKSNSTEHEDDSRSLTNRYQKALELGDPTLSSSTRTTKSQNLNTRQKLVGVAAELFSTTDDEQFDWDESDESEFDEAERAERQKRKLRAQHEHLEHVNHIRRAKRLRKVYLFFMRLSRLTRTTLLLILGCSITITPSIVVILRYPTNPAKLHVLVWSIWMSLNIALSCLISILVDIFPVIAIKLSCLIYGSAPEKLKTQVELWMGVRAWIKIALNLTAYWAALLVMFLPMFPFRNDAHLSYFHWVKRVTGALFGTGLVLLAEKILLQIVKINFHRTSLQDRLEENDKALRALDKLAAAKDAAKMHKKSTPFGWSGVATGRNTPARMHGTQTPHHDKKSNRTPGSTVVDVPMASMVPHTNSSALGIPEGVSAAQLTSQLKAAARKKKISVNLSNMTDQITSVIAQATLKDSMHNADHRLDAATHSAKKLARKLFEGLDEDKGGVLTRDEFEPYFKNRAEAIEAFKVFDKDGNGDIDRKEMRNAVSRIYRERRALATSLKDMSSAVSKLDGVLLGLSSLVIIFIWLFVFNPVGTTAQLIPMATIILGFSFVFGNAAKNLFESMLFIFSIHPYDVGDLIFIDDSPMFVLEFGLFSTTFQRCDGQVIVAPNSVLFGKKHILNVRRSGPMWEVTNVMVSFDTPLDILHEFRTRLRQFVTDHPREWKGGLDVNIDFMQNQNLIQLIVAMEHKSNWQDWGARWDRRTSLMKEMKRIMDQLNMTYKLPIQPVSFASREANSSKRFLNSSQRSPLSMRPSPSNPNPPCLSTASRSDSNDQSRWNPGAFPSLGIQPHRLL
ncbi:hypothetical protein PCANC_00272 [Puccinia coronata f. sp. avenae]|uniref:EF-hand domain-containing protein n=1 Tax=Puccinia coronata f. sp. avenae TaxID=200324 RepID=A0A2N5W9E1_9BASI|nr:hypothetical protein PCASD_23598 [Puccinia coronata f. sp. avenae]PLW21514.1 hypothetical protein PCANC_04981 [Puccinia coronata f. sp. avenae]PLW45816.1 hypothetical protein PCASD_04749 [Puccinia coronata f. sp. avenae]PLW58828.1 hypothetical protein PCANC_00272 [Puccinia coronata f. sp. avenae]